MDRLDEILEDFGETYFRFDEYGDRPEENVKVMTEARQRIIAWVESVIGEDEPLKQPDKALEAILGTPQYFFNVDLIARNELRSEQRKWLEG